MSPRGSHCSIELYELSFHVALAGVLISMPSKRLCEVLLWLQFPDLSFFSLCRLGAQLQLFLSGVGLPLDAESRAFCLFVLSLTWITPCSSSKLINFSILLRLLVTSKPIKSVLPDTSFLTKHRLQSCLVHPKTLLTLCLRRRSTPLLF